MSDAAALTATQAVVQLDALSGGVPEVDHGRADEILLQAVTPEVREAYRLLQARCRWWATA